MVVEAVAGTGSTVASVSVPEPEVVEEAPTTEEESGSEPGEEQGAPTSEFRVLSSGSLGLRLPDTKEGRVVYLDTVTRVKLCEHGWSYNQICHWNRDTNKPPWVTCDCTHARGLFTNLQARPAAPTEVPSYQSILWRDGTPETLPSTGVLAVRIPGKSKDGHDVFMDSKGKTRCPHGFTAGVIRAETCKRRRLAATLLQEWWRLLDPSARAGVSSALRRPADKGPPSADLKRAGNVWRRLCIQRRQAQRDGASTTGLRGSSRICGCRATGLERERFGRGLRKTLKRVREAADVEKRHAFAGAALEELCQ